MMRLPSPNHMLAAASLLSMAFLLAGPSLARLQAEDGQYEQILADYRHELNALAATWEQQGSADIARFTRDWLPPTKNRQILYLTEEYDTPTAKTSKPPNNADWQAAFTKLRNGVADKLFAHALQLLEQPQPDAATAHRLLHQVLRENPDHAQARKILGHLPRGKSWLTEFNLPISTRAGTIDHPQLGWKRGRYWRHESKHFQLTTDVPGAAGKEALVELEQLYSAWRQIFFDQVARPGALTARAKGGTEPIFRSQQHRVVLFRSREEYVTTLGRTAPRIELTTGLYFDRARTSYFYLADEQDRLPVAARYHEVVHQLLHEHLGGNFIPGNNANFWAVEGIATYFESLAFGPGFVSLGGWEADRLQFARYRTLSGDKSWPLAQLLSVGKDEWQQHSEIQLLYRRASALMQFLMDGEAGKYRPALLGLIGAIYQEQDHAGMLTELTKVEPQTLEEQLVGFLQVSNEDLDFLLQPERLRNLSLGLTAVTDEGLAKLAPCTRLEWLDVSRAKVTVKGLQIIANMPHLKQLFLERAAGNDDTLRLISKLPELEELDLTGWDLTNEDLRYLNQIKTLKVLYLSNTPLDDAALTHLRGLPNLKQVDTAGTNITAAGRKQLGLSE